MKKLLAMGLLTVCALAVSEHRANAWMNAKFSIGLNWHLQSGNNNFLWGFWKNGQVPGPEAFAGGAYYGPAPFGTNAPAGAFPYFGAAPQNYPPTETAPPPQGRQAYTAAPQSYYYNPYQSVSYQTGGFYQPNYYYPVYQQYYGPAPSYWYQGR